MNYETVAQARNQAIQIINNTVNYYGGMSEKLSDNFFNAIMKKEGSNLVATSHEGIISEKAIEDKVRYYAGELEEGLEEQWAQDLGNYAESLTVRQGQEAQYQNVKYNEVRYARVPRGANVCGFCIMLASRGFVYHSAESAGESFWGNSYHVHCKCEVIPSTEGDLDIWNYDPDSYYDIYSEAYNNAKAIHGSMWNYEHREMSAEELRNWRTEKIAYQIDKLMKKK